VTTGTLGQYERQRSSSFLPQKHDTDFEAGTTTTVVVMSATKFEIVAGAGL